MADNPELTPIPIEAKELMRAFLHERLNESKHQSMPYRMLPAIIVREIDLERFLDDMWLSINKKLLDHGQAPE